MEQNAIMLKENTAGLDKACSLLVRNKSSEMTL